MRPPVRQPASGNRGAQWTCLALLALYLGLRAVMPGLGLQAQLRSLHTEQTQISDAARQAPERAVLLAPEPYIPILARTQAPRVPQPAAHSTLPPRRGGEPAAGRPPAPLRL